MQLAAYLSFVVSAALALTVQIGDPARMPVFLRPVRSATLALGFVVAVSSFGSLPASAQDAASLAAAREVVAKMQPDRTALLASMAAPMVPLIQQMGIREADKAQVLVQEVILPTLTANYDKLLDSQAKSYASVLSVTDLKGVAAFYDTPAGWNFVTAQPQLAQA